MAPNRLASETSPYLLQHAHNPVDWYPWSEAALNRAQREDRPILLSIGYSACHWCHVMERESFEDPAIAELMNEHFVCIKVDREERPDVDDVYMAATIALTGSGGWPMTVFLTPEGAPFFAGTYFPPEDRGGRPGFRSLLSRIAELWEDDRDQLFRQAGELTEHLTAQAELGPPQRIAASVGGLAAAHLERSFDREWGGYGSAPKFPPSQALHLLLRHHVESGDVDALSQVTTTLDAMKNGGLYDQLGGGFARYSTDEKWLVPHFEKMLYDNAQLASVYLESFQVTREPEYERIVTETLDFVIREMQAPEGGYFSAIDADSEGVEGKFYTFTTKELRALLEPEETRAFCAYYGVTEQGNFEGRNVLHTPESPRQVRERLRSSEEELDGLLRSARAKVFAAREERVRPAIDDKVLVSWNALMIGAMAEAGRVLGTVRHLNSGVRAAEFIFARLVRDDGRLLRTARAGTAHLAAYLEDYAYLVDALVDLYEATGVPLWLTRAEALAERLLADFHDPDAGAFFQTAHDHERLLFRARDGQDGALPNANAVAARALYRLGRQLDEVHFQDVARASLQAYGQRIARAPRAHLTAVNTLELMQREPLELVFAGSLEQTRALREAVAEHYLPRRVIGHAGTEPGAAATPLLAHKTLVEGKPALYICRNFRCEHPITSPSDVAAALSVERAEVRVMRAHVLEGSATAEGTRAYHDAHALDPSAVHEIGSSGIRVSRVGFGTYRIQRDEPDHHRALAFALRGGCNLIDTAASYGRGESEQAIGDVLGDLVRRGEIQRDQVVVVSKLGLIEAMERPVQPPNVELGQGLYHCVDPDWMERELSASLERLGIEALDVCLLHHPEALLLDGDRPRALDSLSRVFTWFEAQIERGRIRSYGLSTSGLSLHAPKPEATAAHWSLEELVASRERLGLAGLSVLELPLNPLELAVVTDGVLKSAAARGFAVFTHRPLNALVGGELWRFAESSEQLDAPELAPSLELLRRLEDEFRSQLGAVLGAVPGVELDTDDWMSWSTHIAAQVGGNRASWNEFERGVLAPRSSRAIAGLDRAFAGKQLGRVWRVFRQRYTTQLEMTVLAARRAASAVTQGQLRPMAAAFRAQRGAEAPGGSLAQSVVHTLGALPGVTSVLVGMRTPSYAREVLQTLGWETSEDPLGVLRAAVESIESST